MHSTQSMAVKRPSPPARPEAGPGICVPGVLSFAHGAGGVPGSAERCHLDWAGPSAGVGHYTTPECYATWYALRVPPPWGHREGLTQEYDRMGHVVLMPSDCTSKCVLSISGYCVNEGPWDT